MKIENKNKVKLFSEIPHLGCGRVMLHKVTLEDKDALAGMTAESAVYRYLPDVLFEQQHDDTEYLIRYLYDECLKESLILGIYTEGVFCGLAEFYGFRDEIRKISVGYRLREAFWGRGIATEALGLMVEYLYGRTDTEQITASTMTENRASARVLEKNGFELLVRGAPEDWGYESPTPADKWIR